MVIVITYKQKRKTLRRKKRKRKKNDGNKMKVRIVTLSTCLFHGFIELRCYIAIDTYTFTEKMHMFVYVLC